MFEEISKLLSDIVTLSEQLKRLATAGGNYLHAYALAETYNYMMKLADERMQSHPEVERVPELRTILLLHFFENADKHINVATNRIFNPILLGSPKSLRDWQEAGHHATRTQSNYASRLRTWKAIYDQTPIQKRPQRAIGEDIFSPVQYIIESTNKQPKDRSGNIVTYEDVIHKRNAAYGVSESVVPWWSVFNYGTMYYGRDGYPSTPGLHFIEDAERELPNRIQKYTGLLEQLLADVFDGRITKGLSDQSTIEIWLSGRLKAEAEYVPTEDVARIVAFGVPF